MRGLQTIWTNNTFSLSSITLKEKTLKETSLDFGCKQKLLLTLTRLSLNNTIIIIIIIIIIIPIPGWMLGKPSILKSKK